MLVTGSQFALLIHPPNRHAALTLPAAQYCLGVWERASAPGAAAAAEADVQHVRAEVLAALLSLLQYRWRTLMGSSKPTGGASGGTVQQQVASAAAAAAAGGGGGGGGAALVARVLQLLLEFFGAAASGAVVRPAADVRLVLEELFELQVRRVRRGWRAAKGAACGVAPSSAAGSAAARPSAAGP